MAAKILLVGVMAKKYEEKLWYGRVMHDSETRAIDGRLPGRLHG